VKEAFLAATQYISGITGATKCLQLLTGVIGLAQSSRSVPESDADDWA